MKSKFRASPTGYRIYTSERKELIRLKISKLRPVHDADDKYQHPLQGDFSEEMRSFVTNPVLSHQSYSKINAFILRMAMAGQADAARDASSCRSVLVSHLSGQGGHSAIHP